MATASWRRGAGRDHDYRCGFPWLSGSFAARPGFAEVEPLFAEELALSKVIEDSGSEANIDVWEAAYDRIAETMSLVAPSGPVAEFLLHIQGFGRWGYGGGSRQVG